MHARGACVGCRATRCRALAVTGPARRSSSAAARPLGGAAASLVAAAVLTGQLSIGWCNDLLDRAATSPPAARTSRWPRARSRRARSRSPAGWRPRPACRCRSPAAGGPALAHLVGGGGRLGLRPRAQAHLWSWLPYAVSFALLTAFLTLGPARAPRTAGLAAAGRCAAGHRGALPQRRARRRGRPRGGRARAAPAARRRAAAVGRAPCCSRRPALVVHRRPGAAAVVGLGRPGRRRRLRRRRRPCSGARGEPGRAPVPARRRDRRRGRRAAGRPGTRPRLSVASLRFRRGAHPASRAGPEPRLARRRRAPSLPPRCWPAARAGFDATSAKPYAPSDGIMADSGDLRVLNALVVAADGDSTGVVSATIANRGDRRRRADRPDQPGRHRRPHRRRRPRRRVGRSGSAPTPSCRRPSATSTARPARRSRCSLQLPPGRAADDRDRRGPGRRRLRVDHAAARPASPSSRRRSLEPALEPCIRARTCSPARAR